MIEFKIVVDSKKKQLNISKIKETAADSSERNFADMLLSFINAVCNHAEGCLIFPQRFDFKEVENE